MNPQNHEGVKTPQARQGPKGGSSCKLGEPSTPLWLYMLLPLAGSYVQSGSRARCPQLAKGGILMVRAWHLTGGTPSSGLARVGDSHRFQLGTLFHLEPNLNLACVSRRAVSPGSGAQKPAR